MREALEDGIDALLEDVDITAQIRVARRQMVRATSHSKTSRQGWLQSGWTIPDVASLDEALAPYCAEGLALVFSRVLIWFPRAEELNRAVVRPGFALDLGAVGTVGFWLQSGRPNLDMGNGCRVCGLMCCVQGKELWERSWPFDVHWSRGVS